MTSRNKSPIYYPKPPRSFDIRTLCGSCPPLQPIQTPTLHENRCAGSYVSSPPIPTDGEPAGNPIGNVFSQDFADGANSLVVSYNSDVCTPPEDIDAFVDQAEKTARQCSGPVWSESLNARVCGAGALGLKCWLQAPEPDTLPHPELLPPYSWQHNRVF